MDLLILDSSLLFCNQDQLLNVFLGIQLQACAVTISFADLLDSFSGFSKERLLKLVMKWLTRTQPPRALITFIQACKEACLRKITLHFDRVQGFILFLHLRTQAWSSLDRSITSLHIYRCIYSTLFLTSSSLFVLLSPCFYIFLEVASLPQSVLHVSVSCLSAPLAVQMVLCWSLTKGLRSVWPKTDT